MACIGSHSLICFHIEDAIVASSSHSLPHSPHAQAIAVFFFGNIPAWPRYTSCTPESGVDGRLYFQHTAYNGQRIGALMGMAGWQICVLCCFQWGIALTFTVPRVNCQVSVELWNNHGIYSSLVTVIYIEANYAVQHQVQQEWQLWCTFISTDTALLNNAHYKLI